MRALQLVAIAALTVAVGLIQLGMIGEGIGLAVIALGALDLSA